MSRNFGTNFGTNPRSERSTKHRAYGDTVHRSNRRAVHCESNKCTERIAF
jgi:hypothetical protein